MINMSFASSRGHDNTYTTIPDEYDSTDRDACFYLYARPLNDAVLGESDDISLHHWSLVAVFVDESIRTMEGNESCGKLMPYYMKETPKESTDCRPGKYYELIPVKTSPSKLHYVTKHNPLNGTKYSAKSNNCQCWVKRAAKSISSSLADALSNYRSQREVPVVVTAVQCSWASSRASSKSVSRSLVNSARSMLSRSPAVIHHHLN